MVGSRLFSSLTAKSSSKIRLPQRLKGGLIEKWGDYWAMLARDYRDVAIDVARDSRKHPLKTSVYVSLIAGFVYAVESNPNVMDYKDTLQRYRNESAMLSKKVRNAEVDAHFHYMGECFAHNLVRRLSLGFCSFLWVDNYPTECGVFKSQCDYLKPRYLTFHKRILDVGVLGKWRVIESKMQQFDINENEWPESDSETKSKPQLVWNSITQTASQIRGAL